MASAARIALNNEFWALLGLRIGMCMWACHVVNGQLGLTQQPHGRCTAANADCWKLVVGVTDVWRACTAQSACACGYCVPPSWEMG